MSEEDVIGVMAARLRTAEAVRDDARATSQRSLEEKRDLAAELARVRGELEQVRAAAVRLDDATGHCLSCRECGDGPCCERCEVVVASEALAGLRGGG